MSEKIHVGRRRFLSAALASASVAGSASAAAAQTQQDRRTKPVLDIGIVGCGPYSHGSYIDFIGGKVGKRVHATQMRITHLWGDDYRRNYAGKLAASNDEAFSGLGRNGPKVSALNMCGGPKTC